MAAKKPTATMTRLHLLTVDGAVAVTFVPELETAQYSELFGLSRDFVSAEALREIVTAAAKRWGREVAFG